MVRAKTLIPNDFRDMLLIISALGFLAIIMKFGFLNDWLSENITSFILILSGIGFLFVGKAITIRQWVKDGIQQSEIGQVIAILFGGASIFVGLFSLFGMEISERFFVLIAILAAVPLLFTVADYIRKNTRRS